MGKQRSSFCRSVRELHRLHLPECWKKVANRSCRSSVSPWAPTAVQGHFVALPVSASVTDDQHGLGRSRRRTAVVGRGPTAVMGRPKWFSPSSLRLSLILVRQLTLAVQFCHSAGISLFPLRWISGSDVLVVLAKDNCPTTAPTQSSLSPHNKHHGRSPPTNANRRKAKGRASPLPHAPKYLEMSAPNGPISLLTYTPLKPKPPISQTDVGNAGIISLGNRGFTNL